MQTTQCYIEKDNKYLMLHRVKKKQDLNEGKWMGVGGKFEQNESPEECMMREVKEETGLNVLSYQYRGIVTFVSNLVDEAEYLHLFTIDEFDGEIIECNEGELAWIDKEEIYKLPMWEGDKYFLNLLLERETFFSMKLVYENDDLIKVLVDGKSVK